ncbi:hypothetical protein [Gracilimonas sp.]|uniref:hypothetical protein n=1 Tax=Gracilimonas sp. TaxID=1974203 RepID=UPI0028728E9E|nr:hypothetical protein [Gracilimonas sp.]
MAYSVNIDGKKIGKISEYEPEVQESIAYLEGPMDPIEVDVIEFNGVRYVKETEKQPLVKD